MRAVVVRSLDDVAIETVEDARVEAPTDIPMRVTSSAVPGEHFTWPSWEDAAVPPEKMGDYLRDFQKVLDKYGYQTAFFGHFGQGCLHTRISFDLRTAEGVKDYRRFIDDAADLVLSYGGSLSGEHGEGQVYSEVMPKMYGPKIMQAFHDFKYLWDPQGTMNPGKVVDAYHVDQNLRLGPSYDPAPVMTHFKFPDDQHSFNHATVRCIGIGKCRKYEGGTMCPSYMVTREEKDTLVIANGFSCRGQIKQEMDRHALHLAQVIQMAMRDGDGGAGGAYPEQDYITPPAALSRRGLTMAGAGALMAGAALTWGLKGRTRAERHVELA
ncbi:MAG: hypothetical protein M3Y74_21470 [Chloroflexota bacterium]|nr:hypothetical protein [Chloroflexota bacterium]